MISRIVLWWVGLEEEGDNDSSTEPLHGFYINLDRRADRRRRLIPQLARNNMPLIRIPAYTFQSYDEIVKPPFIDWVCPQWDTTVNARYDSLIRPGMATMTLGEIGCAASHVRAWYLTAAAGAPRVILEDDAVLCPRFRKAYAEHLAACPEDADVLMLGYMPQGARVLINPLIYRPEYGFMMVAYHLTPAGARKMLAALPVVGPVDVFIHTVPGLSIYCTTPDLVHQPSMGNQDIHYSSHGY